MTFDKWYNKQSRLIQIILFIIPVVNWFVEVLVRWSLALRTKNLVHIIMAVIATLGGGLILAYLDIIWILLFNQLFLGK